MSQAGQFSFNDVLRTITGNAGGAVGPTIFGNINFTGGAYVTVTGTPAANALEITIAATIPASFPADAGVAVPALNTLTVSGGTNIGTVGAAAVLTINLDNTITLTRVNAATFDTNVAAAGVTLSGTSLLADGTDADININITPKGTGVLATTELTLTTDLAVQYGGTGVSTFTDHGVLVGSAATPITALAVGTDGQVLLGDSANDPIFATITSAGTIGFTPGAGSLVMDCRAATTAVTGVVELATDAEAIAGAASTVINCTSLKAKLGTQTDHGVLVGSGDAGAITALVVGTDGQVLIGDSADDPVFATITSAGTIGFTPGAGSLVMDCRAATTAVTGVVELATDAEAIAGAASTVINCTSLKAKLGAQTSHGLPYGAGDAAAIVWTAEPAHGQFLVGETGAIPQLATITAGNGTLVTNAAHSITVGLTGNAYTTAVDGWRGSIIEQTAVTVTSGDGINIALSVEQSGTGDLTVVFSDGFYAWDTSPADTVALTPGLDTAPQINYVYLLQTTKTLTASTVGWPATEHAPIAVVLCQTAASLQTYAAYKVDEWKDDVLAANDNGHINHINYWIRGQHATWVSGVAPTLTITPQGGAADDVVFTSAQGIVLHLHNHTMPAFAGTPSMYVVNDFTTAYNRVTNLNTLLTDSTNVSMSGRKFSLVVWGVANANTGDCKLMVNLPSGSYTTNAALLADANKYADFSIPADFKGVGFLIAQYNLSHSVAASGTWTLVSEINLRGLYPSLAAGGATAAQTEFEDTVFRILDDGDTTKELAFSVGGITTGTTRTITMDDRDIDMDAVATTVSTDAGDATPAAGTLTIAGGTNLNSAGAGSTATINLDATVTLTTVNATTFDTNVAAAAVTLSGTSLLADGTDGDIDINITAKGTGQVIIDDLQLTTDLAVGYGGTGASSFTDGGVLVGAAAGPIEVLAVGTDGQVLLGSSAANPVFATLSSTGTIGFTPGAGTLALNCRAATDALTGVVELATDAEAIAGTASTVINCISLKAKLGTQTDHGLLIGSGTTGAVTALGVGGTGVILTGVAGADPAWTTATYPSTAAIGTILVASGANVITTLAPDTAGHVLTDGGAGVAPSWQAVPAAAYCSDAEAIAGTVTDEAVAPSTLKAKLGTQTSHGLPYGAGTTGAIAWTAEPSDGQLLIGDTGNVPALGTITGGTGISVANAAHSITISTSGGGGLGWTVVAGTSQAMAVDSGYITNNAALVTCTLPDTAVIGSIIKITGLGAGGWKVAQNAGETIYFGSGSTTAGVTGYLSSTQTRDSIELVCVVANVGWNIISSVGNVTIA